MKHPTLLIAIVVLIFLMGVVALIAPWLFPNNTAIQPTLVAAATIFTLGTLILYVYYTYVLAKVSVIPSASLVFPLKPSSPNVFQPTWTNYSKNSLTLWCDVHATVYGQPVKVKGFYGGETPIHMQPLGEGSGVFSMTEILSAKGLDIGMMRAQRTDDNRTQQLRLDVEFWYTFYGEKMRFENPRTQYFYDFLQNSLVWDV